MTANQILFSSATDVAHMLRRKDISSRELTEMLLARIDAVNPALNAIVGLHGEAAPEEAAAAYRAITRGAGGAARRADDDQGRL
jgi:amidase